MASIPAEASELGKINFCSSREHRYSGCETFLIGSGFRDEEVKKYKTLCSWEHKQGVHSLRYMCLLMGSYYYCKV